MSTILDEIAAKRRVRIAAEKEGVSLAQLTIQAENLPPPRDVCGILRRFPASRRALIAEVKRSSPSKGDLNTGLDPAALASAYKRGGAFAISVLVEPDYFGGSLSDLIAVRAAVDIPVLYKDFIVDPYQLWQARAFGADLALLIVALLGPEVGDYLAYAREAGVTALVEVHDEEELALALDAGAELIGVNNRNLKTFATDLAVSERLIPRFRTTTLAVAESGIETPADVRRLAAAGAKAFLVGESLVRSGNPEEAVRALAEAL